jgi:hypothetical protein
MLASSTKCWTPELLVRVHVDFFDSTRARAGGLPGHGPSSISGMALTELSPGMEKGLRIAKYGLTIAMVGVIAFSAVASLSVGKMGTNGLGLATSAG